ncbi:MAG: endonuclease/exonuclease/phosphatase family protein, partial [Prevotella sp.]|nr:endonuclease/exonuclease/phosphatase family protein [Prevotella sp.]
YMLEPDGPFKGTPLRTLIGPRWLKGYSDHLPTVVYLIKN